MAASRPLSRLTLVMLGMLALGIAIVQRWSAQGATQTPPPASATIPPDQLDSLVAPIALYPDSLLGQTLAASTYPLEIVQLQQWLAKNPELKGDALAEAVRKQSWDPSVQALAGFKEVVKRLADDIGWTTDLGNAFLAQQQDVMAAVQRMRRKAEESGKLKSGEQQTVETKTVENQQVIVIEQANPQVIYVPSYNPTVVFGAAAYPYPSIYYPPAAYYPAAGSLALTFGVGMAVGAWAGGAWGWGCSWGHHSSVYVNNNNTFVRNGNTFARNGNVNTVNRAGVDSRWQHDARHRGGAPYRDRSTAERYGGMARGESAGNRQAAARQQLAGRGGTLSTSGAAGARTEAAGAGARMGGGAGTDLRTQYRSGDVGSSGGVNRGGSYDVPRSSATGDRAFDGGFNGSRANAASQRGGMDRGFSRGFSRRGGRR